MIEGINGATHVKGRVRAYNVREKDPRIAAVTVSGAELPGWWVSADKGRWTDNNVLYSWGAAAARVLTSVSAASYRISGMYLEYKNVANAGDVVASPGLTRAGGRSYYDALASSPDTDYLRVPLVASSLDVSDPSRFDDVNRMTFFAMSQGVTGVNGKAFSDTANSKFFGGALVAIVDLGDYTRDVVFSRFYFPSNKQQVKLATSQLGLEWQIALE